MKTIGQKYFQEEERQPFVVHFTEDKVRPFVGESEQFFEHFGEAFYEAKPHVGVQEEPREQNFNNEKLNNKANADFYGHG